MTQPSHHPAASTSPASDPPRDRSTQAFQSLITPKKLQLSANQRAAFDRLMVKLTGWCHLPIAIASSHIDHIIGTNAQHSWLMQSASDDHRAIVIPFANQVWQTGQSLIINDAINTPDFQALPQVTAFPHLNCYAGVPIVGDRLGQIGVLSVMGYTLHQIQPDVLDLLNLVTHEIVGLLGDRPIYPILQNSSQPSRTVSTTTTATAQFATAIALTDLCIQRLRLLQESISVLQECGSLYKAQPILPEFLQRLFPGTSGQVLICNHKNHQQETFELITCWGSIPDACNIEWFDDRLPESIEQSMSARSNSTYTLLEYDRYVCSPLIVHQRRFGLLVLTSEAWQANGLNLSTTEKQFIKEVSQHLAITLHTLRRIDTLQQESLQDPLTGLYNRRHMMNVLDTMLRRATYGNEPLSIIMLDIDYFKRLNDSFGHPAGDQVLKDLGIFLKGFVRPTDVACRYGGEEFTLILTNASKQIALRRADRIRQGIAYITMKYRGRSLGSITVSLGIATFPEDGHTITEIIRAADEALYSAKAHGRNRAEMAVSPDRQP